MPTFLRKLFSANHLRARGAPKSLRLKGLRALFFYAASLTEAVSVKQVIEIFEGGAKIFNNVFDQPKLFSCRGLRIIEFDCICYLLEVFFCHGVFCWFVGLLVCWFAFDYLIERLKSIPLHISSKCQEKIEHGKGED